MLKDKTVVVVAGSSGIGLEVARQAAERGARVIITGRDRDRLEAAAATLPGTVRTAAFDASDRTAFRAFVEGLEAIDHFVSCMGDTAWGSFLATDEARARAVVEQKFWTQLAMVREARAKIGEGGSIVLTAGTAVARGALPFAAAFSLLGNTMVEVLVRGLSAELAPLRINAVQPGVTRTPLYAPMSEEDREAMYAAWGGRLPINRIPLPGEVALSYIHLMENPVMTGESIRADGGPFLD